MAAWRGVLWNVSGYPTCPVAVRVAGPRVYVVVKCVPVFIRSKSFLSSSSGLDRVPYTGSTNMVMERPHQPEPQPLESDYRTEPHTCDMPTRTTPRIFMSG